MNEPEPIFSIPKLKWLVKALAVDPRKTLAVHRNTARSGVTVDEAMHGDSYTLRHSIIDGIERVHCLPAVRRFETPLFFQHGMWHGAWCWREWQALFASWGWESVAISLPGHAGSPEQRPLKDCTLDYYLGFIKEEMGKFPKPPVYIGHSMGGGLGQWYLKYVGDNLPAVVMLAAWVSHSEMIDGYPMLRRCLPEATIESLHEGTANPFVSTTERAAAGLLGANSTLKPEELFSKLGPESGLVMFQHTLPFWKPPKHIQTPMLWIAAEKDAFISLRGARRSADYYHADFVCIEGAAHNLMMERDNEKIALKIHQWLQKLSD